ncbi:MAG: hypothetical protein LBO66_11970 [Deltaproteobacteria bacterium]|jgi:hypothetical protein|nr:hypothetical protein [Deltaproteobacteria bacterium]
MLYALAQKIWSFWGSVKLSIVLCFLLALDAALAYPLIRWNLTTFIPLGEIGIFPWLNTYGRYNLGHTFWFFALLVLLALLAVNAFVCATDRLWRSWKQRQRGRGLAFFLKLGPHVMHYAVLVILLGYLGSYALSESLPGRALTPNGPPLRLPRGQGEVRLEKTAPVAYRGERLEFFRDWLLDPGYELIFDDGAGYVKRAKLAYSVPARFRGYRFYLYDFYPKREEGGSVKLNYVKISIRRDPSAAVYLGGIGLFVGGLLLYAADVCAKRRRARRLLQGARH